MLQFYVPLMKGYVTIYNLVAGLQ